MNVFVLCTGRCGSVTFVEACQHISNYSAAHESRCDLLGEARLAYPENHIEADNRLSWFLGRLDERFGDDAFYVHLRRNDRAVAQSFARRYSSGMMQAYGGDGIVKGLLSTSDPVKVGLDYCTTVNANIRLFLKDKSRHLTIDLEEFEDGFSRFWSAIGAEGDYDAAIEALGVAHNAGGQEQDAGRAGLPVLVVRKIGRLIRNLPGYIRQG